MKETTAPPLTRSRAARDVAWTSLFVLGGLVWFVQINLGIGLLRVADNGWQLSIYEYQQGGIKI